MASKNYRKSHWSHEPIIMPPTQRSCWGVYWFLSVPPSLRPSVCPSVLAALKKCCRKNPWIMEKHCHGMNKKIIWPMIVGALIHEAGTVIQAPKPVCQFMAEDTPQPVLNQLVIRYLVNLLVRIKEPSSPTG